MNVANGIPQLTYSKRNDGYKIVLTGETATMSGLRRQGWTILEDILNHYLRKELLVKGLHSIFSVLSSPEVSNPTQEMQSGLDRPLWAPVTRLAFAFVQFQMQRKMNSYQPGTKSISAPDSVNEIPIPDLHG